jgi:O-succinylbenzoate synthase
MDAFDVMMFEQPLHYEHDRSRRVQRQIRTPICLDESIQSAEDAQGACDRRAASLISNSGALAATGKHERSMMFAGIAEYPSGAAAC